MGSELRPEVVFHCDFEQRELQGIQLVHGTITHNASEVMSGEASCKASSLEEGAEWVVILEGTSDFVFASGHTYWIRVGYRILAPGDYQARVVMDLYSPDSGRSLGGPSWTREEGAVDVIDGLFGTGDVDDWRLRFRLHHRMAVVLDDIVVYRTPGKAPGDGDPIKNTYPPKDPDLVWLEELRARQQTEPILRDMVTVVVNGGCGIRCWPWWDKIVEEIRIDWADWQPLPRSGDGAAAVFGIRTTASGAEYQEYYSFESEHPDLWPKRFETYFEDGFNRSYENTFIQDEFFGQGGYFTCHNSPKWHDWIARQLEDTLQHFEGICQDNIGCAPFDKPWGSKGCFCPWCEREFRASLALRYSPEELAAWGIDDLESFSFRERFLATGRFGEAVLEDPVAREWLKFQYRTHMEAWKDLVLRLKRIGVEQERFVPVGGNQFGSNGSWPFALLLSQWNDYIEIEDVHEQVPGGIVHRSLTYKAGLASGEQRKPVWVRSGPNPTDAIAWKTALGEALANGGVKTMDFAEAVYYIEPVEQERWPAADGRAVYEVYKAYAKMVDENRAAFARSESEARVAVVFSFPSMMWSHFPPYRIDSGSGFDPPPFWSRGVLRPGVSPFWLHEGVSSLLDEQHIQHDFIMFGHPELLRDDRVLVGLSRYDVLVLPYAPCVSDAQAAGLQSFVENGGQLVKIGEIGVRDENYDPRQRPALESTPMPDLLEDGEAAMQLLTSASNVETNAPESVRINRWRIIKGHGAAVHLISYDKDDDRNLPVPAGPIHIEFPAEHLEIDSAILVTFDNENQSLPFSVENGRVHCTVAPFEVYAVVIFAKKGEYDAANREAAERRRQDRQRVRNERYRVRELYKDGKAQRVRATVPGPSINE
jgi:hypothetical protein